MSQVTDLVTGLRADPRVTVVERALLQHRLGLAGDDLELLTDATVRELLTLPTAVTTTVAASRLLKRLDARLAREHPVNLDYPDDLVVATVFTGDERRVTAALDRTDDPPAIRLEVDDREVLDLDADDAESLAYALLRLVATARLEEES